MSEACLNCPDCGGVLVRDSATGEIACKNCGIVVEEVEYVPQFVPKTVERGSLAFADLSSTGKPTRHELIKYRNHRYLRMVGRSEGRERTVANISTYISILADRIGARPIVEEEAIRHAKRLLRLMRKERRRLTTEEIAAISLWQACKVQGFPITMRDYEDVCAAALPGGAEKA